MDKRHKTELMANIFEYIFISDVGVTCKTEVLSCSK